MVEMDPPKLIVVTDFLLCGWPIMGTNFREWVQTFQQNSFWGEPNLGGSKLNVTATLFVYILNKELCHAEVIHYH